jgi:branched-chain amino acid transport system ATP-binding protein
VSGFVLETMELSKSFGALAATRNVSLRLPKGARHALIGPNGAGKTTLVSLLSGVVRPDSGRILLSGRDVTREAAARRVRQGLVRSFQINNLFRGLTVLENVFLAISEHTRASRECLRPAGKRRDLLQKAESVIERLSLADDRHRKISEIAYGRQRLVEIAIALSLEPKVLLLDEPAAGIPSADLGRLIEVIDRLPADLSILMIEHDMHVVRRFATEVTVLVAGAILMSGSPQEVMASEEVHVVYLGQSGHARFAH